MGNIEIKDQSPSKRRKSIFNDRTVNDNIDKKPLTPKNTNNISFSSIKYSNKRKQIFDNCLTQRKVDLSRLKQSKFSNKKIYLPINNCEDTGIGSRNTLNVKAFEQKLSRIQIKQKQNIKYERRSPQMGKIVANSRRINFNHTITSGQYNNLQNIEIIKKVRNFNDFLNQIKKKLREDKQKYLQRKKTSQSKFKYPTYIKTEIHQEQNYKIHGKKYQNQDINPVDRLFDNSPQKHRKTRRLQVALKLENQKIQLQKYRKLVERQLSKNHSIESILLSTKKSGERILTIEYENTLEPSRNNRKAHEQQRIQQKSGFNKDNIETKRSHLQLKSNNQTKLQRQNEKKMLEKLRQEYKNTMRNLITLGKHIDMYERQIQQDKHQDYRQQGSNLVAFEDESFNVTNKHFENTARSSEHINKIQGLFSKLSIIQDQFIDTDRQIKQLIYSNSEKLAVEESNSYYSHSRESSYQHI